MSAMGDSAGDIAGDVAAVGRIEAVPTLLRVLCDITGMRFAAVARVTDGTWTACAVQDEIAFGLAPGGQLDLDSTLCKEVRETRVPVVIEHASEDARYCDHHTPRIYAIQSYVSVPIVLPNGDYFGNLCAIDPDPAPVGEPRILSMFNRFAALIAVQLDVERRQEVMQSALLSERAASELREQLVGILGHDLRVPLGIISMNGQLLQNRSGDPTILEASARINSSAKRMASRIDDILDFTRGRLGSSIGVRIGAVERIDEALFGVVSEMQQSYPGRRIDWQFGVGRTVHVDRGRIQQLAANLLANALEHGAADSPVSITAASGQDEWVLEVHNEGEPLSAAAHARLFAPFWRNSGAGRDEGLGLGLHICAEIVKAHGGTIRFVSVAPHGTTVTVRLPCTDPG